MYGSSLMHKLNIGYILVEDLKRYFWETLRIPPMNQIVLEIPDRENADEIELDDTDRVYVEKLLVEEDDEADSESIDDLVVV